MKWIPDTTARFRWRPYYEQEELDNECERIVTQFLRLRQGEARFPLSDDDLEVMIEKDTSDLDLYADLSREGRDVEGMTEFFADKKPVVKISRQLSLDPGKRGRLRITLAHEYGHVKLHSFLWDDKMGEKVTESVLDKVPERRRRYAQFRKSISSRNSPATRRVLFSIRAPESASSSHSRQTNMLDAPFSDWMEWQAGYAAGSILMPLHPLRTLVLNYQARMGNTVSCNPREAGELAWVVAESFDVPSALAAVRLEKLGLLQNPDVSSALPHF